MTYISLDFCLFQVLFYFSSHYFWMGDLTFFSEQVSWQLKTDAEHLSFDPLALFHCKSVAGGRSLSLGVFPWPLLQAPVQFCIPHLLHHRTPLFSGCFMVDGPLPAQHLLPPPDSKTEKPGCPGYIELHILSTSFSFHSLTLYPQEVGTSQTCT